MMRRAIPGMLLCLCAALPASGADLELSAAGEVEYDDNVFRREEDEEEDVLFRLRPAFRVFEDRGDDLNYSVGYELPIEFAVDNGDRLDRADHVARGAFDYHVSDRVQLFGQERFGYLRSTFFESGITTDVSGEVVPEVSSERDRVTLNDVELGALYQFNPRTSARVVASSDYFDSTREDRARVWSAGATAEALYRYSLKHQFGGGLGYAHQDFDDRIGLPGSRTDIYRVFGSWRWLIDDTLTFDASAGPSYLDSKQDRSDVVIQSAPAPFVLVPGGMLVANINDCGTINGEQVSSLCPVQGPNAIFLSTSIPQQATLIDALLNTTVDLQHDDPSGGDDSNLTVFAAASLSKRWTPTLATALNYTRQQGNASGLGGTVITDAISLANTWDFRDRWQLAVRGDWTRRESAFDQEATYARVSALNVSDLGINPPGATNIASVCTPGGMCENGSLFSAKQGADIDTDRWSVAARITHRLFRTTSVYVQLRYDEQESRSSTLGSTSDFDNFLATFGVRHVFEPIKLW